MTESTIFIVDNSLYSQNQDYLPTRYMVQLNTINYLLSTSSESHEFGVIPIAQPTPNFILTPTKCRLNSRKFLNDLRLAKSCKISDNIFIAERSFQFIDSVQKRLILFLGSSLDDTELENTLLKLRDCSSSGIAVFVFLFGNALNEAIFFEHELKTDGIIVMTLDNNMDFKNTICDVLNGASFDDNSDPNLALALKLSAEEAERNKNK